MLPSCTMLCSTAEFDPRGMTEVFLLTKTFLRLVTGPDSKPVLPPSLNISTIIDTVCCTNQQLRKKYDDKNYIFFMTFCVLSGWERPGGDPLPAGDPLA